MTTTREICPVIGIHEPNGARNPKVSPREFLSWASTDLKSHDRRARGNALSNIKKSLHARVDELIDRTHIPYSNDWNPRNAATDTKLAVIRRLGIRHDAVVDLITSIRNDYEHGYRIPSISVVRAHLSTCELWLDKTYDAYDFPQIAIAHLPVIGIALGNSNARGSTVKSVRFLEPAKVLFFWNTKRILLTLHPNGDVDEKRYRDLSYKEMLRIEAPLVRTWHSATSRTSLNQASVTDLYTRYRRWLSQYLAGTATCA